MVWVEPHAVGDQRFFARLDFDRAETGQRAVERIISAVATVEVEPTFGEAPPPRRIDGLLYERGHSLFTGRLRCLQFGATRSRLIGVPRRTSRAARRPRMSGSCLGGRPKPGRIERTFSGEKVSPAAMSRTA